MSLECQGIPPLLTKGVPSPQWSKPCRRTNKERRGVWDMGSGIDSAEVEEQIAWFQARGFLAQNKTCPVCNNMQQRQDVTDKYRYNNYTEVPTMNTK